jgi:hypothetical protein
MSLDASINEEHAAMWASIGQPKIPFGYKQTHGQLQKGDAIWNGEKFVRVKRVPTEVIVRKTKMLYPCAMEGGAVAIRRCEVVQETLPGVACDTAEATQ